MNKIDLSKEHFIKSLRKGQLITLEEGSKFFSPDEKLERRLFSSWYESIINFSFLPKPKEAIEEIMVFTPTEMIYKYAHEKKETECDITSNDLQIALDYLTLKHKVSWNYTNPFVSFKAQLFSRNVRVSLSHYSISSHAHSACFIRFQTNKQLSLSDFGQVQTVYDVEALIKNKKNILICGSTGSGKTTYLNSLLELTSQKEHLLILEDTQELKAPHSHTTNLLTNDYHEKNQLNTYLSYALRMSPDRIVLGEIRSQEVEPFLLAMNTGHKGLLSTVHANNAVDALHRLALLFKIYSSKDLSYELVLKLVCTNIDTVIFMENKEVREIIQVFGAEQSNIFFEKVFVNDILKAG